MHFINFIFQSVLLPEVLINTGFEKKKCAGHADNFFFWYRQRSNHNKLRNYQKMLRQS